MPSHRYLTSPVGLVKGNSWKTFLTIPWSRWVCHIAGKVSGMINYTLLRPFYIHDHNYLSLHAHFHYMAKMTNGLLPLVSNCLGLWFSLLLEPTLVYNAHVVMWLTNIRTVFSLIWHMWLCDSVTLGLPVVSIGTSMVMWLWALCTILPPSYVESTLTSVYRSLYGPLVLWLFLSTRCWGM